MPLHPGASRGRRQGQSKGVSEHFVPVLDTLQQHVEASAYMVLSVSPRSPEEELRQVFNCTYGARQSHRRYEANQRRDSRCSEKRLGSNGAGYGRLASTTSFSNSTQDHLLLRRIAVAWRWSYWRNGAREKRWKQAEKLWLRRTARMRRPESCRILKDRPDVQEYLHKIMRGSLGRKTDFMYGFLPHDRPERPKPSNAGTPAVADAPLANGRKVPVETLPMPALGLLRPSYTSSTSYSLRLYSLFIHHGSTSEAKAL
ncbi:hypothetical protein EJ06DRAFT_79217 [Trichodelitschia bisporula]|uniref:Uncharacterized protein n=1 Tax=Trichodelitschia bisporula TaxID=703511 RepID=A0A6G1HTN7_9PEZI|nr:hypothetical protein EJ06DRAFT_79217 [Trichodelitschia bisporula]